jgi:hypothetical protein
MHTSKVLQSSDFQYTRKATDGGGDAGTDCLYTGYQVSDRIGVVTPRVEDGLLSTSYALLGLTTSFYDRLRASSTDFFDYPQHFALLGTSPGDVSLDATWGNLDVWPDSQWLFAQATATAMIKKVFDLQINRLFWPETLGPLSSEERLPQYVRRILGTRLKSVWYYNATEPDLEIQVSQPVENLVQASLAKLPSTVTFTAQHELACSGDGGSRYRECHRHVAVQDFLASLGPCFEAR